MTSIRKLLDRLLRLLAGLSMLAMVLLVCWQVLTRYALGHPSTWSEELVSYMFAWGSLFGASLVVSERGHMNVPVLVDLLKPRGQKFFHLFAELLALLFSLVILVYGGVKMTVLAYGQMTSSLKIAVGFFYIALPLCGVFNVIYCALNIVELWRKPAVAPPETAATEAAEAGVTEPAPSGGESAPPPAESEGETARFAAPGDGARKKEED